MGRSPRLGRGDFCSLAIPLCLPIVEDIRVRLRATWLLECLALTPMNSASSVVSLVRHLEFDRQAGDQEDASQPGSGHEG